MAATCTHGTEAVLAARLDREVDGDGATRRLRYGARRAEGGGSKAGTAAREEGEPGSAGAAAALGDEREQGGGSRRHLVTRRRGARGRGEARRSGARWRCRGVERVGVSSVRFASREERRDRGRSDEVGGPAREKKRGEGFLAKSQGRRRG
jgi:hypothetical protein